MQATKKELAKAFKLWNTGYLLNPYMYEKKLKKTKSYAMQQVETLLDYLKEAKNEQR